MNTLMWIDVLLLVVLVFLVLLWVAILWALKKGAETNDPE